MMKKIRNVLPENEILQMFSESERDEVSKIWKLAKKQRTPDELDASEVDAEWKRLQMRLMETGKVQKSGKVSKIPGSTVHKMPAMNSEHLSGKKRPSEPGPLYSKRHSKIGRSFRMKRLYPVIAAVAAMVIAGFASWYYFVPVTIEAPRGAFVSYEWDDGTRVELNSGSQLTWNRSFRNGHRAVKLHGEAYFDVPTSDRVFEVHTQNALIRVLGTRFNVRSWGANSGTETILTLVEGEVTMASFWRPDVPVILQPGQWSRVDHQAEAPYDPEEIDTSRALAWRDQGFYFASTPLSEVANELERRFNREIELGGETLAGRNLTLYLPTQQDLESIISSICLLTGCRYDWSDDQIILY